MTDHDIKHKLKERGFASPSWVWDTLKDGAETLRDETVESLVRFFDDHNIPPDVTKQILCEGFAQRSRPPISPLDIIKAVDALSKRKAEGREVKAVPIADVLLEVQGSLDKPLEPAVPTHILTLNDKLDGGFRPGELIFLAAGPGVGKSALAVLWAIASGEAGFPTLIISMEMMNEALARRALAQRGRVSASLIRRRELNQYHIERIVKASTELSRLPILLCDTAQTLDEVRSLCETHRNTLKFLVVDYLQLIGSDRTITERRHQVEHVSKALKGIAKSSRIPVLCLSAVKRPDKDKSLSMTSLRESGMLEHDADTILLLDRAVNASSATLILTKQRDGPTAKLDIEFEGKYVRFFEKGNDENERRLI